MRPFNKTTACSYFSEAPSVFYSMPHPHRKFDGVFKSSTFHHILPILADALTLA